MIRIRKKDKSTITLPKDAIFVEFVNDFGEVIQVFSENSLLHTFSSFGYPSEKADKYSKFFDVNFVKDQFELNVKGLLDPNNDK